MKTMLLALLFVAASPDAGQPVAAPVVVAQPVVVAAAPAVVDAGVPKSSAVQNVLNALPPPPSDAEVPGQFEKLGKALVDGNYLAAIIPLAMIGLWFLNKMRGSKKAAPVPAPAADPIVPPAKPEDPKPEQK